MPGSTPSSNRPRTFLVSIAGGAGACLALALLLSGRAPAQSAPPPAGHQHMAMSEAAMNEKIRAWFAVHPETQSALVPAGDIPADTFLTGSFYFDNDGDPNEVDYDTAYIQPGQSIYWEWVDGSHTTTNGIDTEDPDAGTLWNHSLNSTSKTFTQVFPNEGTFPFFCFPHSTFMKGYVVVQQTVAVRPLPDRDPVPGIGFLSPPTPNPSSGRVLFLFGLHEHGHVRAEVMDARGRLVAVPVDENLGVGTWGGMWDGKATSGASVSPGVYFLRLTVPGARQTKTVVLAP